MLPSRSLPPHNLSPQERYAPPQPPAHSPPWHRELTRAQWRVLAAAFLGWIFDGYEAYALFLAMFPALSQLLEPAQLPNLSSYAGILLAATLLGWAVGGVLGGIAADYFGRKRTMMATILVYACFTGLTGFSQSWMQLAAFRFLTGLGLGGEWATGATLIAESWPSRARAKGQGIMQSAFGWGSLVAAAAWYVLQSASGPGAWRILFFLGVVPAFFVLYIRRNVPESEAWLAKQAERRRLGEQRRAGRSLSREEAFVADFTVVSLFRNPALRRLALLAIGMSIASSVGYWAVATWIPAYTESVAQSAAVANPARWGAIAGLSHT
ncbi:MAG: MFS transporter, partial [Terriglobia bacterium]